MFDVYIKSIKIEEVRNLSNILIPVSESEKKNIVFTGKNGSGKTSLLESISHNLFFLFSSGDFQKIEEDIRIFRDAYKRAELDGSENEVYQYKQLVDEKERQLKDARSGLSIEFNVPNNCLKSHYDSGDFIAAYFGANRTFNAIIPRHIESVELKRQYSLEEAPRMEFVKYIADLKVKEALAKSSGNVPMAESIHAWFLSFDQLLKTIFEDDTIELTFDPETYEFNILQKGKDAFGFNVLSDGYAAALDIIVDLMMRMEKQSNRSFAYDMPGIVMIDEIETHLHLELQRNIMRMLTSFFPNIQFIVTTHSPFILNSVGNAIIYDLEKEILVKDGLNNVPYSGIVEGYFGADQLSSELRTKFDEYKKLVKKEEITDEDLSDIMELERYLEEIPDYLALDISTEFHKLKLQFQSRGDL